jgi:uncharacterized membrane protein YccC
MFATVLTPLVVIQLDLGRAGTWELVLARLVDTVVGCAVVLIFGYLLWPGSRRPQVGGRLAAGLDVVAGYVKSALTPAESNAAEVRLDRSRARRKAYRALADLRTAFQQVVVEPSANGRQAIAWWPVIAGLERVADAVTEVAVTVELGASTPAPADVELVTDALAELAAAVREQRLPVQTPLPETDQLSGVADQVVAAFEAVRGPDLDDHASPRPVRWFQPRRRQA